MALEPLATDPWFWCIFPRPTLNLMSRALLLSSPLVHTGIWNNSKREIGWVAGWTAFVSPGGVSLDIYIAPPLATPEDIYIHAG